MQTLILTGESVWKNQRSRLKQLLPAPCTNFIFEAYERIEVKGSKLYSLDLDHQRMTGERFELSPSHLVYVNQNDALRDTAKYVEIEAAPASGKMVRKPSRAAVPGLSVTPALNPTVTTQDGVSGK